MKMGTLSGYAYLALGSLNAALFGLMAWMGYDLMWTPEVIASAAAFAASAILLMRAPFSKRNIDRRWVSAVRVALALFLCYVEYRMVEVFLEPAVEAVTVAISAVVLATVGLLLAMPAVRARGRAVREAAAPRAALAPLGE